MSQRTAHRPKPPTRAAWLVPLACVCALLAPIRAAPSNQDARAALHDRVLRLSGDEESVRAELESLAGQGEEASLAALDQVTSAGPLARRRRAHLVFRAGGARSIGPALAALADPDPGTRADILFGCVTEGGERSGFVGVTDPGEIFAHF